MKLETFTDSIFKHYFGDAKWEQIKEQERANPLIFNLKKVAGILLLVVFVIVTNVSIIYILWRIFNK